jgi:hypothetical protein
MCKDPLLLPRDRRGMGGSFGFSDGVAACGWAV